ncbi:MAG: hypothetical protein FE78DRAFT_31055 [Acidomyces sp. 'richmondensis']|nr:MAG: hypothetical protein FE78DRAFT_31055 [Acidomyces sp. 'richmondensis']
MLRKRRARAADQYFVAGTVKERTPTPVMDKNARVHKKQLRPPRVRSRALDNNWR